MKTSVWMRCAMLLLCLVAGATGAVRAQDRIVRRDSTVIEARVLVITPDEVQYKRYSNPDGPTYVLPVEMIHRIVYPNGDCDLFAAMPSAACAGDAVSVGAQAADRDNLSEEERAVEMEGPVMQQHVAEEARQTTVKVTPKATEETESAVATEPTVRVVRAYAVGDYYDENGIRGVVCAVSDDGLHGLLLSIEETTAAWCALNKSELQGVGASDTKDGRANMEAVAQYIARGEASWEDFPAFAWCRALGEGWYLPAIDELLAVCANYNGGTRLKNDRDARSRFNETLRDNGGRRMDRLVFYYSSTEADGRTAYCSHTSLTPPYVSPIPKGDRFLVRAVRRF